MFRSYLKIALRNLTRSKVYSLINISGLSMGVACCLLLALYVQDELGYDRHHDRLDDIYRIDTQFTSQVAGLNKLGSVSPPIAMTLREELPEVEEAARVLNPPGVAQSLIKYGDNIFYESDGFIADSTVFDILTFPFTTGNPKKALTQANTVVISESMAHKIFGNESALDKSISISQGGDPINYKITGVFQNEQKSFLHVNFLTSMMSEGWGAYLRTSPESSKEWAGQNFIPSYLKLTPGASKAAVEKKMNEILIKYGAAGMKALGFTKTLSLEPIKDIYLKSETDSSKRITYLYIIASLALFILVLACINFMNLSTAKATKRASEIGIRKVLGAFRGSLIRQILGEAMVIVVFSILISIILVQVALPAFNQLSGKSIMITRDNIGFFLAALAVLTLVTGLAAGSYPAFYMSSFQPAQVLKGKFNLSSASGTLRQSLVIFQFMIAIILVCGMLVISKQLTYIQEKDLGFDARAKIVLPLRTGQAQGQYENLKRELLGASVVHGVSGAGYIPGSPIFNDMAYYTDGGNMETAVLNRRNRIDAGYMELLGIKLLAGRNFTSNRETESKGKVIINKTSALKYGFTPEKMVGQQLHFDWHEQHGSFEVIGVMDDYNQTSLKDPIIPVMFEIPDTTNQYRYLVASVTPAQFSESISTIEKTWKQLISDTPFEFSFLDDTIQKQYDDDRKVSRIITAFTVIAMIICSLGLYGLSSFMAERRFKEIGIRKVMGASVQQIVAMMSKEFIKLVGIAFVLAVPLAWYAMTQWLEGFAYKIPLDITLFLAAGLSAVLIALITISYESIRAASTNPVVSLRSE